MLTVREAADSLGLSPSTLHAQIKLGVLKATKRAGLLWIAPREVERYRTTHKKGRTA